MLFGLRRKLSASLPTVLPVRWRKPSRKPSNFSFAAVRALSERGVRYLLVSPGVLGANEFCESPAAMDSGVVPAP